MIKITNRRLIVCDRTDVVPPLLRQPIVSSERNARTSTSSVGRFGIASIAPAMDPFPGPRSPRVGPFSRHVVDRVDSNGCRPLGELAERACDDPIDAPVGRQIEQSLAEDRV